MRRKRDKKTGKLPPLTDPKVMLEEWLHELEVKDRKAKKAGKKPRRRLLRLR